MGEIYRSIEAEIPRLRRYARALARDVATADDLVQDCLARALGKLHLWQEGTDLRAWLFTILHNQYVNQVRRAVREGAAVGLSETEPMLTRAPHQGKSLELRDLERAIAKLPEEQRAVILLVGLEGMRYEEVAEVLGVPVGTVRSRLSRGREALRRLMGIVPDRQAEIIMAEPAALRRANQRFPGRVVDLGPDRRGAAAPARARTARDAREAGRQLRPELTRIAFSAKIAQRNSKRTASVSATVAAMRLWASAGPSPLNLGPVRQSLPVAGLPPAYLTRDRRTLVPVSFCPDCRRRWPERDRAPPCWRAETDQQRRGTICWDAMSIACISADGRWSVTKEGEERAARHLRRTRGGARRGLPAGARPTSRAGSRSTTATASFSKSACSAPI